MRVIRNQAHLTSFVGSKIAVCPGTNNPRYAAENVRTVFRLHFSETHYTPFISLLR